jgi:hypothetical protein
MPEVATWLIERGVSSDVLTILVFIPVLVTLTSFSRYITGIKTFGIYSSMVLAIAYYYMGFVQAFTVTMLVILSSWIFRNLLKKVKLHYLSRLAIVYCGTSIFILAFIVATSYLPTNNPYLDFTGIQFLPLALIISITDRFMANYIKKDLTTAARLTGETLLLALIGWGIMRWDTTHTFFMTNLWVVPLLIVVNLLIGQYAGFRWTEFIRFNQVIRSVDTPPDSTKK